MKKRFIALAGGAAVLAAAAVPVGSAFANETQCLRLFKANTTAYNQQFSNPVSASNEQLFFARVTQFVNGGSIVCR